MLSVVLDYEEIESEVLFGMDEAELELHDDGSACIVFVDYHSQRTIQVGIGSFLLEQIAKLKSEGSTGFHFIEQPQLPGPDGAPF